MILIIGTLIFSTFLLVGALKAYITVVSRFEVPLSNKDSGKVLGLWFLLTVVVLSSMGLPAEIIKIQGDPVERGLSLIPLFMGSLLSGILFRKDWHQFLHRFDSKQMKNFDKDKDKN